MEAGFMKECLIGRNWIDVNNLCLNRNGNDEEQDCYN